MTCKDCLNYKGCYILEDVSEKESECAENCPMFKDKSRYLYANIPIGKMVYEIQKGTKENKVKINGKEYIERVPNDYITQHEYSWIDAMCESENQGREKYLSKEEARKKLNEVKRDDK